MRPNARRRREIHVCMRAARTMCGQWPQGAGAVSVLQIVLAGGTGLPPAPARVCVLNT